ncbi:MAG: sensor histidine kinase [Micromonosporaceae bacterium]
MSVSAVLRGVLSAPLTPRARREALFCLAGLPFVIPLPAVAFYLIVLATWLTTTPRPPNPTWPDVVAGGLAAGLVVLLLVTTGAARGLARVWRGLAARLLGDRIGAPPPVRAGRGVLHRLRAVLRDGPAWRALAYLLLKLPAGVLEYYALFFWVAGVINLSYPFWWGGFRNHAPGVRLSPVPVFTPFGWFGQGTFRVATFGGTFAAFGAGACMVLAAPWVTRAVVSLDRWLIRSLAGPGGLAARVRHLEQTRALAVDDSAALLRQVERNLHDGAQIRLATLAMNLGMAKEKLGGEGAPLDLNTVRELVDAAHRGAKDALSELRELARGIHPPVLDNGLADALATLAAGSAIPVSLTTRIPARPSPAIESIAYFCAAELLANAVKHSSASSVTIEAAQRAGALLLTVADDGTGGADPVRGSGLSGLMQRVRTVDGRLDISSPMGGPTRVTVELPLHA